MDFIKELQLINQEKLDLEEKLKECNTRALEMQQAVDKQFEEIKKYYALLGKDITLPADDKMDAVNREMIVTEKKPREYTAQSSRLLNSNKHVYLVSRMGYTSNPTSYTLLGMSISFPAKILQTKIHQPVHKAILNFLPLYDDFKIIITFSNYGTGVKIDQSRHKRYAFQFREKIKKPVGALQGIYDQLNKSFPNRDPSKRLTLDMDAIDCEGNKLFITKKSFLLG